MKIFLTFHLILLTIDFSFSFRQFEGCKTPVIKNGKFRSRQRGRVVRFYCNPGYFLAGERTLFCSNAMWEEPIPKCVRATCKQKVNAPKNGLVLQSNVPGMVNFYCQQGYVLNGPAAAYCDGVVWDVWNPSCIPTHEKPSFFCDFEDENICHWTHDISHDMEWTRDNFKTPSGYSLATGPSHDHTKGNNSNGHYMYIESSSKRTNDTARLVSPIFSKINNNVCLEFWYHMYGTTTGTLRAYVRKTSEPWPPKPEKAVFSKSGNQGNHWYQALVNLGNISEDFQIVMEGVRGPGYVSDIAIDDVRVIPNCIYAEWIQITTTTSLTSEAPKSIESCENRCGQKVIPNDTAAEFIPCDCDELCDETHRCCPDYIELCLPLSSSTFETTTWETTESTLQTTSTKKTPMLPTLIILEPPTTPEVIQKIFPVNKSQNISSTVKTVITTPKIIDDVITLNIANEDEELLVSTSAPNEEESNDINNFPDRDEYVDKCSFNKNCLYKIGEETQPVGEIKTDASEKLLESGISRGKLIFIVVVTLVGLILLGILSGVAMVNFRRYRRSGITSGAQGDSQSDVRFLTADEVLDFNMVDTEYD